MTELALKHNLKESGLKLTLPRMQILELLEEQTDDKHLSAEDIYKILIEKNSEIGLATVYRVLTQFEAAGIVNKHNFDGMHAVFELNDGKHHDHMVCEKCGLVQEFHNNKIEELQQEVALNHQFNITDHSLYLYGLCAKCSQ